MNIQTILKMLIVVLLTTFISATNAQKVGSLNLQDLEYVIKDKNHTFYYPELVKKYYEIDYKMSIQEYFFLYYGSLFTSLYQPYEEINNMDKIRTLYQDKKFKNLENVCDKILLEKPLHLELIYYKMISCVYMKDSAQAELFSRHYYGILDAIKSSGNGFSENNAFVVLDTPEIYELIKDYNAVFDERNKLKNYMQEFTIHDKNDATKKTKLYFNLQVPQIYLSLNIERFKEEFDKKKRKEKAKKLKKRRTSF